MTRHRNTNAEPSLIHVTTDQLISLGVSWSTIKRRLKSDEWKTHEMPSPAGRTRNERLVLVSSLPVELQLKWAQKKFLSEKPAEPASAHNERPECLQPDAKGQLIKALLLLPADDRVFWIAEALRLFKLVMRYGKIRPKRERDPVRLRYKFVPSVHELCLEAACHDSVILSREPHRALPPSPYTLDGWWRESQQIGLLTFLRRRNYEGSDTADGRLAVVSPAAASWMNNNWSQFYGPRPFYKELEELASQQGWKIPSESWVYRQWQKIPAYIRTYYFEGKKAYESKHAPYVPRDFSDLQALQVLAGDHSERDVTVSLPDGTIRRPWLTLWYDLRTGLIWGWYLSLSPSSQTAGLAYASGVQNFGAQPFSRPESGFYSYVLTDRGRDYKSHNWDGREIEVHKEAMSLDGGFELLLVNYRVGIVEEFDLKHLLTRGRNPKQNPVERVHRDISEWEKNTFEEYCGSSAKDRPERWRRLYERHQQFRKGKRDTSPYMSLDQYRQALAGFIIKYNSSSHERRTLGGGTCTPIEEFRLLYTTRYEISEETLSLLVMKAEKRRVRKNGVQCFQKNWFYYHESMSAFKGTDVEVRFSDDDYSRVFVILPNHKVCQAELITPTSLINPDKRTINTVRRARAFERGVIKDFTFIAQSNIRGESVEDRVARQLDSNVAEESEAVSVESPNTTSVVHKITRLDGRMIKERRDDVTVDGVAHTDADDSIFVTPKRQHRFGLEDEFWMGEE